MLPSGRAEEVSFSNSVRSASFSRSASAWVKPVYTTFGSINCQLAEKTGFSEEDAALLKEALRTLFENDASSARPDGSMEVLQLYWWKHNCRSGQYASAKVHRLLHVEKKVDFPRDVEDYTITCDELPGLEAEVYSEY